MPLQLHHTIEKHCCKENFLLQLVVNYNNFDNIKDFQVGHQLIMPKHEIVNEDFIHFDRPIEF